MYICGFTFLFQFCPEYISQHPFQVNIMKELPAGGHLYEPVLGNDIVSIQLVPNAEKNELIRAKG